MRKPARRAPAPEPVTPEPVTPEPVTIAILRNPLDPASRILRETKPGDRFIKWLTLHYPKGFGGAISLARNGRDVEVADADFITEPGDVITIVVHPGAHLALGALIVQAIIGAAIGAATSLIFNLIFGRPKGPTAQDVPGPDPIYSISGAQNAARLGDPVPALYGRMVTTPDYASQPYSYFDGNNQYLAQILCIGWGDYDINAVRVGETPVSALESDAVATWQFGAADHAQTMGRIEAATGVMENVVSSPEVADQEFSTGPTAGGQTFTTGGTGIKFQAPNRITGLPQQAPAQFDWVQVTGSTKNDRTYTVSAYAGGAANYTLMVFENTIQTEDTSAVGITLVFYTSTSTPHSAGPFITSKPGTTGDRIMCDFVFAQGLYDINQSTGAISNMTANLEIQYQPIDDTGAALGDWTSAAFTIQRATTTPVRVTFAVDVPPGRYRVQVVQTSPPPPSGRAQSNFVWSALKFRLVNAPGLVYGQTTLLALRIRATNGIASNASSRISVDVTRRLPALGSGAARATRDPADAFVDIYSNTIYGARRPLSEIDLAELARLQAHWGGQAFFDGGFAQRSTIWEALNIVMQTAAAAPLPLGQVMSVAQDGTKALRTQLFSDANMKTGTLAIGYSFDKPGDPDGVRVEYRDPSTWNAIYATWPAAALDPDPVQLFGCTDDTQALGFARLLWQKRSTLRKTATFETELEGLIPRLGDRIAIATQLPRWARTGVVSRVALPVLTLDAAIDWTAPEGGYFVVLRNERGAPSDPIAITPGATPFELVLAALPPFTLFGTGAQEATHYALGTAIEQVADFTIANVEHRGGASVAIEALTYDPAVFASTLPWLGVPI
jgi:hypothetical protein